MEPSWIAAIVLAVIGFGLIYLNVPVLFSLIFAAVAVGLIWLSPAILFQGVLVSFSKLTSFVLVAIPLFIFMGAQLRESGEAGILYNSVYKLAGGLRGSLAIATVVTGTLIAAMSGVSGAGTVALGLLAHPIMKKYNYSVRLSLGTVSVAGALGALIPPSVVAILYGGMAGVSIAKLYAASLFPGLLISVLSIAYIFLIVRFRPEVAPVFPLSISGREKAISALNMLPTLLLIGAVLGTIYTGVATPTEAAVIGAAAAIVLAVCRRTFRWKVFDSCLTETARVSCMVMMLLAGGGIFSTVFAGVGGEQLSHDFFVSAVGNNPLLFVILSQVVLGILGCLLDIASIIVITVPIFLPMLKTLGIDPLWFGVLFTINMQLAVLTPPFGMNLFYLRAIAPLEKTSDVYAAQVPFLAVQVIALVLVIAFPIISNWLPAVLFP